MFRYSGGMQQQHYLCTSNERYWQQTLILKQILSILVAEEDESEQAVAVAGSAALHWCQDEHRIGPNKVEWTPRDLDLFICCNERRYRERVHRMLRKLSEHQWHHKADTYLHMYGPTRRGVLITEVKLAGFRPILSLVQSPFADIPSTVANFDIDVCRVAYFVKSNSFVLEGSTLEAIASGKATIRDFDLGGSCKETELIASVIKSSIRRVAKYQKRGFEFTNFGKVMFARRSRESSG